MDYIDDLRTLPPFSIADINECCSPGLRPQIVNTLSH